MTRTTNLLKTREILLFVEQLSRWDGVAEDTEFFILFL